MGKEQKEMMEKGFNDQVEIMGQEIKELNKERKQNQEAKPGFFQKFIMSIAKIGDNILSSFLRKMF